MTAKATDTIAILRVLKRFGGGTVVAVSTGGEVETGLLAGSVDTVGCDSFATGGPGAATGFDSGWILPATSAGGGVAVGCATSATTGGAAGVAAAG